MSTPKAKRLIRKLLTVLVLVFCLTALVTTSGANASRGKTERRICCSLCSGEPTDPGACRYGCNENC